MPMKYIIIKLLLTGLFFLNANFFVLSANTQEHKKRRVPTITSREVESFLSDFLVHRMKELHVPGLTFSMVKNGRPFLYKGYGFANIEKEIPANPVTTIFRTGSISKLITATAVIQLVEQGKLNLDQDINTYLTDFKIRNDYPVPITIAHLLTHTAGFDYEIISMAELDKKNVKPLTEYLSNAMPRCVYPPGNLISYSNYGFTLAGYLVERISGQTFQQYIQKNILEPLRMNNSGFAISPKTTNAFAQGYVYKDNSFQKMPFEYYHTLPASSFVTTSNDIGNFMIALLQDGRFENIRIMGSSFSKEMKKQQFSHHQKLPGVAYAFYEYYFGKHRMLIHEGEVAGFKSLLVLYPDDNFGFFLSINCEPTFGKGAVLVHEAKIKLLNFLYPQDQDLSSPKPLVNSQITKRDIQGYYRYSRYSHHTISKLDMLFADIRVKQTQKGLLLNDSQKYIEISPGVFESLPSNLNMRITFDNKAKKEFMFIGSRAFEKLKWYETKHIHTGLLIYCSLLFLLSPLFWFIQFIITRRREQITLSKMIVIARWVASIIGLINIILLVILALFMSKFIRIGIVWHIPLVVKAALIVVIGVFILTIVVIIYTIFVCKTKSETLGGKIHYILVALAGLFFIWFLYYWNLVGFNFG